MSNVCVLATELSLTGRIFDMLYKLILFPFNYAEPCITRVTNFAPYLALATLISLLSLFSPLFLSSSSIFSFYPFEHLCNSSEYLYVCDWQMK